jgi:HAMP domain-containing protein
MSALWKEILAFVLILAYLFLWYLVERRIRSITRRHVEKI